MDEIDQPPADVLRLRSSDIPVADRMEVVREVYGRTLMSFDLEPVGRNGDVSFDAKLRGIGESGFSTSRGSALIMHRTRQQLSDGREGIYLATSTAGFTIRDDKGREIEVPAGSAGILSLAREHHLVNHGAGRSGSIQVSRKLLRELVPNLDDTPFALVAPNAPGLSALLRYVALIADEPLETPELRKAADEHIHQLFAIVAGATGEALDHAVANGVAAGRLRAIKAEILQQLGNPSLNLESVALRQGVTPRYVQRLFEREGTSFTRFLGEARLSRAHAKLTNRNYAGVSILSIAFECGFADISTFNRAFRRAYGMTPSEARNAVR